VARCLSWLWFIQVAIAAILLCVGWSILEIGREISEGLGLLGAGILIVAVSGLSLLTQKLLLRRQSAVEQEMGLGGLVVSAGEENFHDLSRIHKALSVLKPSHGNAYDARALEAVVAVLHQHRNRPSEKHEQALASEGCSPSTSKLREIAKESRDRWQSDVARAELLILDLEKATHAEPAHP
jgi:hypothetical protein